MNNATDATAAGAPNATPTATNYPVMEGEVTQEIATVTVAATAETNGGQEEKAGGGWVIWLVVAVVVVAAAVGALLLLKKRKAAQSQQRERYYGAETVPDDGPVSGPHTAPTASNRRPGTTPGTRVRSTAINRSPAGRTPQAQRARTQARQAASAPQEDYARTEAVEDDETNVSRYRVGYAQTVGKRENQEDSYCISSQDPKEVARCGLLAAVADGIGGLSDGEVASNAAMRAMITLFPQQDMSRSPADRLLELTGKAQQEVLKINQQGGRCGSTLVSVLIHDNGMVMMSVGDSRIALYRSGVLLQLNREHVLGKESDEELTLNRAGAVVEGHRRKAITAYVGKENLRLLDRTLTPMRLVSGDRVLLMSDGVFGALSDDEIISALGLPPDQAASEIIRMVDAKNLPHQDNATVVIVGVN